MRVFIDEPLKKLMRDKVEVVVNGPLDDVFGCVADVRRYKEWLLPAEVTEVETSEGPVRVGSTFTVTVDLRGYGTRTTVNQVTEFVPNKRLVYETAATGGGLAGTVRNRTVFEVNPADGGTRVTRRTETLQLGLVFGSLLLLLSYMLVPLMVIFWLVRPLFRGRLRRRLRRIESMLVVRPGKALRG